MKTDYVDSSGDGVLVVTFNILSMNPTSSAMPS